uniref:Integral membrane bound transporter domain-containing protein n=1 Tax=Chromera velia CCMP2878 TaxID=1169474 RepID=A0A0G4F5U4_9ALVE|eukprot:Cvel_15382.t1-p1 / transcript=Cvel_15382.t1 / gene=Cvel_15382 / organism=Chromera_velia_CCMP2878 / gene_product=hypothetical protein / transcript_product=hypothetical protein / location=Cvel_scaffold1135:22379-30680(+) / protein_length=1023 / sequence_SO=supercontig / SO=protein_coding / is_pseudo=false
MNEPLIPAPDLERNEARGHLRCSRGGETGTEQDLRSPPDGAPLPPATVSISNQSSKSQKEKGGGVWGQVKEMASVSFTKFQQRLGLQMALCFFVGSCCISLDTVRSFLGGRNSNWVLISAAVCLEGSMGASRKKGLLRILGTMIAGLSGILVILVSHFTAHRLVPLMLSFSASSSAAASASSASASGQATDDAGELSLSGREEEMQERVREGVFVFLMTLLGFFFMMQKERFKDNNYAFTIAMSTLPIVAAAGFDEPDAQFEQAVDTGSVRLCNVLLGVVLVIVVSTFALPVRATDKLLDKLEATGKQMGRIVEDVFGSLVDSPDEDGGLKGRSGTDDERRFQDSGLRKRFSSTTNGLEKISDDLAAMRSLLLPARHETGVIVWVQGGENDTACCSPAGWVMRFVRLVAEVWRLLVPPLCASCVASVGNFLFRLLWYNRPLREEPVRKTLRVMEQVRNELNRIVFLLCSGSANLSGCRRHAAMVAQAKSALRGLLEDLCKLVTHPEREETGGRGGGMMHSSREWTAEADEESLAPSPPVLLRRSLESRLLHLVLLTGDLEFALNALQMRGDQETPLGQSFVAAQHPNEEDLTHLVERNLRLRLQSPSGLLPFPSFLSNSESVSRSLPPSANARERAQQQQQQQQGAQAGNLHGILGTRGVPRRASSSSEEVEGPAVGGGVEGGAAAGVGGGEERQAGLMWSDVPSLLSTAQTGGGTWMKAGASSRSYAGSGGVPSVGAPSSAQGSSRRVVPVPPRGLPLSAAVSPTFGQPPVSNQRGGGRALQKDRERDRELERESQAKETRDGGPELERERSHVIFSGGQELAGGGERSHAALFSSEAQEEDAPPPLQLAPFMHGETASVSGDKDREREGCTFLARRSAGAVGEELVLRWLIEALHVTCQACYSALRAADEASAERAYCAIQKTLRGRMTTVEEARQASQTVPVSPERPKEKIQKTPAQHAEGALSSSFEGLGEERGEGEKERPGPPGRTLSLVMPFVWQQYEEEGGEPLSPQPRVVESMRL